MLTRLLERVCPFCCCTRLHSVRRFSPARVVVVHKTSRIDFERKKNSLLSQKELAKKLSSIGNYPCLLQRHEVHQGSLESIHTFLASQGLQVRDRDRESYSVQDVEWADTIISAGGDGNFLFTASKVFSREKLIVGLNTDPSRSEGFLCLPSQECITKVLTRLFKGEFAAGLRQRVRVTLEGTTLPIRALNEVFVGEKNHSHATYYEIQCDGGKAESQKSSGLLIYTGTGSTSWAYNVNKITTPVVQRLFGIAQRKGLTVDEEYVAKILPQVTEVYNSSNVFEGNDTRLAYTAREPIARGIYAACNIHGYAKRISVRSLSWNTAAVIDGAFQFDFPYGSHMLCYTHPQDALWTIPA